MTTVFSICIAFSGSSRLNHVSGVWLTLATDLVEGTFYRPLMSDVGYGGTRFFPLHFTLHAILIKWGLPPLAAGYLLTLFATFLMLSGLLLVLLELSVPRQDLWIFMVLGLAASSSQLAITTIRGDLLPAAMTLWGLHYCIRLNDVLSKRYLCLASLCFTLAFSAKITTLFGPLAASYWLLSKGNGKAASRLIIWISLEIMIVLLTIYLGSETRVFTIFSACATGGAKIGHLIYGPVLMVQKMATRDVVCFLTVLVALALIILFQLWRKPSLAVASFVATAITTGMIFASPGTDYNHFLDLYLIAIVVLASSIPGHVLKPWLYLVLVMTGVITTTMQVGKLHETYRQLDAVRKELVQLIQNHQQNGNLVLSQDPLLPVMAKQTPFIMDPFMLRLTREAYPAITEDLWNRIRSQTFSAVILKFDPATPRGSELLSKRHFGPQFPEVLLEYYRPHMKPEPGGNYFIYLPRNDSKASESIPPNSLQSLNQQYPHHAY